MRIIFPGLPLEPSVILKKEDPEAMIATPRLAERLLLGGVGTYLERLSVG
jgi:hypothetical protein